jgi:hypothetical protein
VTWERIRSANRQPIVEDQLGKRPHFAWAGVVPHSSDDLRDRRVAKVQVLDKSDDVRSVLLPPCISVSPLSRVVEEGGVAHVARLLPVPISEVPREIGNEARLKNPIDWAFFSGGGTSLANLSVAPWLSCASTLTGLYPSRGMVTSCELVAWIRPVLEKFFNSLVLAVAWDVSVI